MRSSVSVATSWGALPTKDMTDRYHLERLAAKAAGIHSFEIGSSWCPRDRDADCFTLAVALDLSIMFINGKVRVAKHGAAGLKGCTLFIGKRDKRKVVREAVLMAAAEIGEKME